MTKARNIAVLIASFSVRLTPVFQPLRPLIALAAVGCNDGMGSSRFLRGIMAAKRGSHHNQEEADMDATTVAVDLAKDVFEVALANRAGRIIERKRLTRRQFERLIDALVPGTTVVMEACGTAHYWGRRAQARHLQVHLLPPQYVRPYVRRNKTDRTDAAAILEAARSGDIRPVPVKTLEQQTLQALHRVRRQWQADRTARINAMRGLLREHGLPMGLGARTALTRIPALLEDATVMRPDPVRHLVGFLLADVRLVEARIVDVDQQLTRVARETSGGSSPAADPGHRRLDVDRVCRDGQPHSRVSSRPSICQLARTHAARVLHRPPPTVGPH
jgi:transposase